MEEGPEFKHACKFCNKSFPCGRSLGGHMRSHLTNNSAETNEKFSKRSKILSVNNGDGGSKTSHNEACFEAGPNLSYGLRENPKKTWRLADSSTEETSVFENKLCRECGKGFQSWKALFGHMKRHSEKERASMNNSLEEQDSWTTANQKMVMDSQSDNETMTPNRKRRSKRRTRYMGTTNSSSFSVVNNGSSSVSEIELEQEEVAMCLMMLSRDGNHWGGSKSVAESSDNFSESSKAPSSKNAGKTSGTDGSEISKSKKFNAKTNEHGKLDSGFSKFWSRMNGTEVKDKIKMKFQKDESEFDQLGSKKYLNSSKRSLDHAHYDPELRSDSLKKLVPDVSDRGMCKISHKRRKFECTTCNKVFHSYQALGGHRASHKKTKGCFASIIDSSENSIETDNISPEPTADDDDHHHKNLIDHHDTPDAGADRKCDREVEKISTVVSKKSGKGHECPICLKVFPSGQALGGHKRSHLIGANSDAKSSQTIVIEKPIPGIRDFLDLNLPAPDEEDSNGHVASLKPWWAGTTHKHEALVGLISN
ncbi:Zinc finger transcription factor [Trema orientale]|uniref:Zinc finger transcription factor n=1 Tax=Trema orientale TaxID=63057 RepID=A0A2P5FW05_TREOI|nr:Zinc finger transcription factor [Trema orientale]